MPISTSDVGIGNRHRYFAIGAVSAGTALAVLDGTIANVALPTIAAQLGISASSASLIVTVHQLTLVMLLLPCSALGARIGYRRLYQMGQFLFIAASLLCFYADDLLSLLLVRMLQAAGTAATLSVSSALIRIIYPADRLGRGLGINSFIVAVTAAFSPSIGGFVLTAAPWQWVFAAAIPLGVLSLGIGYRSLPNAVPASSRIDVLGAALSAATLGLIVLGLTGLAHGWRPWLSAFGIIVGICLSALAARREARAELPIMPLDLLGRRQHALTLLGFLLAFGAQMTLFVSLPFRLQSEFGMAPVEVGAVMSAWPLALMLVSPIAGALSDRIAAVLLGPLGMVITTLGLILIAYMPEGASEVDAGLRMAICGFGFGLFLSPNARVILGSVTPSRAAAAGGLIATTRLLGQALGASLAGATLAAGMANGGLSASVAAGLAMVAGLVNLLRSSSGKWLSARRKFER